MVSPSTAGGPEPPAAETVRQPTLLASASFTYASQVAAAVLSLANVLIVSRALGAAGRGDVVFLTTVAWISSQIASLSISQAVANIPGRRDEHREAAATNAVLFAIVLGVITVALLAGFLEAYPGAGPKVGFDLRLLAFAVVPPLILSDYLSRLAFAEFRFGVANTWTLIPPVTNVFGNTAFAVAGGLTVASAFSVWVAGQLVALGLLVWVVARRLTGFGRPDRRLARDMAVFGLKSHGSRVFQLGNYRFDQWLVGAIAGSRELGIYSVAVAWSEALFILPRALMEAQRPFLVRSQRRTAGEQAAAAFRFSALSSAPIVLAVMALAPFLCVTIFGSQFHGSIVELRVLVVGAFGISAMKIMGNALIAQSKPLLEAIATAAAFCLTLVLDVVLIPPQGGLGAAIASTIAYTAGGLSVAAIAVRTLSISPRKFVPGRREVELSLQTVRALRQRSTRERPLAGEELRRDPAIRPDVEIGS